MDTEETVTTAAHHEHSLPQPVATNWFSRYRFVFLLIGCITLALVLVAISLQLYSSSGTAQLDLSRPGYQSVREQISKGDTFDDFAATGPIDEKALKDFKQIYEKRAAGATSVDAFRSDVLSDEALSIDEPPVAAQ